MTASQRNATTVTAGPQRVGLLIACTALVFVVFAALGTWQLVRLSWKLDLIARVEQRVHAKEVAVPSPIQWPTLTVANDEYRRVHLSGVFAAGQDTLVQAVTELGAGFWVLTPLKLADSSVVMVNRGFVPTEASRAVAPAIADGRTTSTVTGLLRLTQPGGGFLRKNDPINSRWYSRDVQAIAKVKGLTQVAPYFVDADALPAPTGVPPQSNANGVPTGGLTVIDFHNNHLVYALTWYALAAMVAGAAWYFSSAERRLRHDKKAEGLDGAADN